MPQFVAQILSLDGDVILSNVDISIDFSAPLRCQLTVSTKTSGDGTMVIEASSP